MPQRLEEEEGAASVQIGDEVWVKPPNARCTTQWGRGRVTEVNSRNIVSVDGMPRYILDVRRVVSSSDDEEQGEGEASTTALRRPQRERHPLRWMDDFEME